MKYFTSLLNFGFVALLQLQDVLGKPISQAAGASSKLISDYSTAPAPTVQIGASADFISIDSTSKIFKINGKTQYFAGTNTWWLPYTYDNADVDKVLSEIAAVSHRYSFSHYQPFLIFE
ncbi:MAG: hypothetical protein Q9170_008286 [Blastenia crenularia]